MTLNVGDQVKINQSYKILSSEFDDLVGTIVSIEYIEEEYDEESGETWEERTDVCVDWHQEVRTRNGYLLTHGGPFIASESYYYWMEEHYLEKYDPGEIVKIVDPEYNELLI